jgi:hypothetical protein
MACQGANRQDQSDFDTLSMSPGGCGAPHGAFSGVGQGRHVNHLLVGLPYLALNKQRLPGRTDVTRMQGSPVP